jgi:DNA-binding NarL/FixJ family response regulator
LLRVELPKVSGFEGLGWIRCQPKLANLTVVLSDWLEPEVADTAYRLGADQFIAKPSDLAGLCRLAWRLASCSSIPV